MSNKPKGVKSHHMNKGSRVENREDKSFIRRMRNALKPKKQDDEKGK